MDETLEQARKRAGFTQQEMADHLGCSRSTYAAIEANPYKATVLQAKTICSLLSRNYEYIFFGKTASKTNETI
ncbi:helix-turn-helix transcriptional regulator [Collinsella vaginalis]|uniref:helix-turn-helix transcriptional regulator n=1 Tax=Collinsella vaginalis TaxID=1870987 RepID=UPI000A26FF2D|nr:helix-turn-helix domain-containing protein [Collinsella vaginalis]